MSSNPIESPRHQTIRTILRVGGPLLLLAGLTLLIVGMVSFFSSFGTFESPRYFWCAFVSIPLLFVGQVMSFKGYMGSMMRYMAGETAPVAKDVVNYMGENIQPGIKAVAKAVTEGIMEAKQAQQSQQPPSS